MWFVAFLFQNVFRRKHCPLNYPIISLRQAYSVSSEMRHGCRKFTGTTGQSNGRASMLRNNALWQTLPRSLKTLVMFGSKIESPPAHPDTVITTLVNLERALNSFGIQFTHVTVDLQLYQTACIVQYSNRMILCAGPTSFFTLV